MAGNFRSKITINITSSPAVIAFGALIVAASAVFFTFWYLPWPRSGGAGDLLTFFGAMATLIVLFKYLVNITDGRTEKEHGKDVINESSFIYRAEILAKEISTSQQNAYNILVRNWLIWWITTPLLIGFIAGIEYILVSYFVYLGFLAVKALFNSISANTKNLD